MAVIIDILSIAILSYQSKITSPRIALVLPGDLVTYLSALHVHSKSGIFFLPDDVAL